MGFALFFLSFVPPVPQAFQPLLTPPLRSLLLACTASKFSPLSRFSESVGRRSPTFFRRGLYNFHSHVPESNVALCFVALSQFFVPCPRASPASLFYFGFGVSCFGRTSLLRNFPKICPNDIVPCNLRFPPPTSSVTSPVISFCSVAVAPPFR